MVLFSYGSIGIEGLMSDKIKNSNIPQIVKVCSRLQINSVLRNPKVPQIVKVCVGFQIKFVLRVIRVLKGVVLGLS